MTLWDDLHQNSYEKPEKMDIGFSFQEPSVERPERVDAPDSQSPERASEAGGEVAKPETPTIQVSSESGEAALEQGNTNASPPPDLPLVNQEIETDTGSTKLPQNEEMTKDAPTDVQEPISSTAGQESSQGAPEWAVKEWIGQPEPVIRPEKPKEAS